MRRLCQGEKYGDDNFTSVQKKVRSKVNSEMDDHTKVDIFTNELKIYMKFMYELEEHHFGSLLK